MRTELIKHIRYKPNISIGITKQNEGFSFFVINKNVTWHPCIVFKTEQTAVLAAKEYANKI